MAQLTEEQRVKLFDQALQALVEIVTGEREITIKHTAPNNAEHVTRIRLK